MTSRDPPSVSTATVANVPRNARAGVKKRKMIKIIIYLPNGRTISAFLKKRQYNSLVGQIRQNVPIKKRIKKLIK